jgi:molybdopterin converting factor small subunit
MEIKVRLLAGAKLELGRDQLVLQFPAGATRLDLERELARRGLDPASGDLVVLLNGRASRQWPEDRSLSPEDEVLVFNLMSGG